MTKYIFEKELLIEELNHYLDNASSKRKHMECMLNSLREAFLVMTEAHQQECCEKDKEIAMLTSQLTAEASTVAELENKLSHMEDQLRKTSTCATVALLIVNRLSELNSSNLDALKNVNIQLMELAETNAGKDTIIQRRVSVIDEAEKYIQSLRKDTESLEASCSNLGKKLSEEQNCANSLRQELEEYEANTILKTGEKLTELKNGVSEVRSYMKDYMEGNQSFGRDDHKEDSTCFSGDESDEIRTGTKKIEASNDMISHFGGDMKSKSPKCSADIGKNMNQCISGQESLVCQSKLKNVNSKDATIMLLKKEIESALESLKGVKAEMAKLHCEKEKFCMSEKESQRGIESIASQVVVLHNAVGYFEEGLKLKIDALEGKLLGFEKLLHHSCSYWFEQKEFLEAELGDARVVSTQKDTEASCILAKFEEVQDTMKDADIMINELIIANETLKLEVLELKKTEALLICDRDSLLSKVQSLQSINDQNVGQLEELERWSETVFETMNRSLLDLELIVSEVQTASMEDCLSVASDFLSMKSHFHESIKLISSCLEDIWSEIIIKDSAISVLHLCHVGILLETSLSPSS